MTPLSIVMLCIASILFFIIIIYFIGLMYFRKFRAHKANDFILVDKFQSKKGIVFLGDSLTDFFPLADFFPNQKLCERGIAGDQTKDVLARLSSILALEPQKLFLQIGINDLINKGRKLKPATLGQKIMDIAEQFIPLGTKVYIISLYPVNPRKMLLTPFLLKHATNKRVEQVNAFLKERSLESSLTYIDVHTHLLDHQQKYLEKEYTIEGLHLSMQGYCQVAEVIRAHL